MSNSYEAFKTELYGRGYDIHSFKISKMVGSDLPTACCLATPDLKKIVSRHFADFVLKPEEFSLNESVELTTSYFWLSLKRLKTFHEQMDFLAKNLRFARSWEITDSLSQFMEKGSERKFLPYYASFTKSRFLYQKRFAYVYAMKFYREKAISPFIKGIVPDEEYYVYMGQAWLLATLAINHYEEIRDSLVSSDWPLVLKRKTISKMVDSFRITNQQKQEIKEIRAKL